MFTKKYFHLDSTFCDYHSILRTSLLYKTVICRIHGIRSNHDNLQSFLVCPPCIMFIVRLYNLLDVFLVLVKLNLNHCDKFRGIKKITGTSDMENGLRSLPFTSTGRHMRHCTDCRIPLPLFTGSTLSLEYGETLVRESYCTHNDIYIYIIYICIYIHVFT